MALPKRYARLVGSRWTSTASLLGWRHFEVIALEKDGDGYRACVAASCDRKHARTDVPAAELFDRARWTPGWTLLKELRAEAALPEAAVRGGGF